MNKKHKMSIALDKAILDEARAYVKRTPGMTLSRLARVAVVLWLEKDNKYRAQRRATLRRGRRVDPFPKTLTPMLCACGAKTCQRYGFHEGVFVQGSGFEKALAYEIARRYALLTVA